MKSLLSVRNITKRFARHLPPVAKDVSFEVYTGEIFALLGPSGCGKTTTLRLIAGFERADAGEIFLEGQLLEGEKVHLPPEVRGVGIVFQEYALFPHLSVLGNVVFGLKKLPAKARHERVMEVLEMVGLAPLKDRKPHELSGGEQQRVALARSIATSPKLILLDEPFSNLDAGLRHATREEVRTLLKRTGMSTVLVTHDQEEALSFADRLAVMQGGRIEQIGAPETVYHRPQTPFVADFLGKTNLITGEAEGDYAETPIGRFRLDRAVTGKVLLSLRPEHLTMSVSNNGQGGKIVLREFKGHDLTYRVQIGEQDYLVQTDYRCPFQVGDWVQLRAVEPTVIVEGKEE
ncbi:MAG: ABC transporter ATP-binding protein [Candidatus Poribacteria bacterium]|nr:ABC transporter ATP-binding protein [Candidatus Poribacteria bacterium]